MLKGIFITLHLSLISWVFALILGVIIGTLRITPRTFVRGLATAYTEIFRNIPILVQLFIWYFAVPKLLPNSMQHFLNNNVNNLEYLTAVVALSFYTSARVAENIRSGFLSIRKEQFQAALSTGLSRFQMYRYVIIPYAIRIVIPPLTAEFIGVFKNSSLVMVIAVTELTFMSQQIESYTFHGLETTFGASMVYIMISLAIIGFMGIVESKFSVPGLIKKEVIGIGLGSHS
jgi:glutamate/aspartate transport system permease protein